MDGRLTSDGKRSDEELTFEPSFASLFGVLWEALADLLGTAATATLVRRAARRASERCPELGELVITRDHLDYAYTPPRIWKELRIGEPPVALRELLSELRPLLVDLTGTVAINHLDRVPLLREHGLVFARKDPP